MEKEPLVVSNKSCKTYFLLSNNTKVYFSGDFDSGNLEKAEQISEFTVSTLLFSIESPRDLIKQGTPH